MRFLGLDIRRTPQSQSPPAPTSAAGSARRHQPPADWNPAPAKLTNLAAVLDWSTPADLAPGATRGERAQPWLPPLPNANLYRLLRENVPLLEAAINKFVRLVGYVQVEADTALQPEFDALLKQVRVNFNQRGFPAFFNNFVGQMLQYGASAGEIVLSNSRRDLFGLYNLPSPRLRFRADGQAGLTVGVETALSPEPRPAPEPLLLMALRNAEGMDPYGVSLFRSLPFVTRILVTVYHALGENWARMGSPSYQVTWRPPEGFVDADGERTRAIMREVQSSFVEAMKARKETGEVRDFFASGDIQIRAIMPEGQALEFTEPHRALLEQVIAATGLPPFLLGVHWSTTERMSQQQADILIAEIKDIRHELTPVVEKVVDTFARVRGLRGKWQVKWSEVTLQDLREQAEASYRLALADKIRTDTMLALIERAGLSRPEAQALTFGQGKWGQ